MNKKIMITGAAGFIGHHLIKRILETTDWEVYGIDIVNDKLLDMMNNPKLNFIQGNIIEHQQWIEDHISLCDTIIPLAGIATPATYISHPIKVFEMVFEVNLPIVKSAVKHKKHLVWPSTSEVYGMSDDKEFNTELTNLVYGPVNKPRWIYACSKQMMDRLIFAYGQTDNLNYTIFRPFNWIGTGLDDLENPDARVITKFVSNILKGINLQLVNGGEQHRCFTDVNDGVEALIKIIENKNNIASKKIYNVGNPNNNYSIEKLALTMLETNNPLNVSIEKIRSNEFYGEGYQDVVGRVPDINDTTSDLNWLPKVTLQESIKNIFNFYTN